MARDEATLAQGVKPVVQLFRNWAPVIYHVAVDSDLDGDSDETLRVTGEHPFYVAGTGFVPAKLLPSGAVLSTAKFEVARVTSVSRERAPPGSPFRTYNFEVADYHTYFVGESQVWVHNLCSEAVEEISSLHRKNFIDLGNWGGCSSRAGVVIDETSTSNPSKLPSCC